MRISYHSILSKLILLSALAFSFSCGNGTPEVSLDFVKTFEGKIDNSVTVCMKLTCKNGIIDGKYFDSDYCYEMPIVGTLSKYGDIMLEDEGDPETGFIRVFTGKLNNDNRIEGTCKGQGSFYLISTSSSYESERRNCGDQETAPPANVSNRFSDNEFLTNANSVMGTSFGISYSSDNVCDGIITTWWSPETGKKSGCWIYMEFESKRPIYGISIHGGSHYPSFKNMGDLYPKNLRIKQAKVGFKDGSYEFITLDDIDDIQEIRFSSTHVSDGFTLYPLSYYPSEKWQDVCISHLTPVFQ
ncbi:MAG: NADase-type glycan-binding domain-containing protein [Bacteroidota bacterium]